MGLPRRKKPGILNRVLHVPDVEHSLVSMSSLCDDDHCEEFKTT